MNNNHYKYLKYKKKYTDITGGGAQLSSPEYSININFINLNGVSIENINILSSKSINDLISSFYFIFRMIIDKTIYVSYRNYDVKLSKIFKKNVETVDDDISKYNVTIISDGINMKELNVKELNLYNIINDNDTPPVEQFLDMIRGYELDRINNRILLIKLIDKNMPIIGNLISDTLANDEDIARLCLEKSGKYIEYLGINIRNKFEFIKISLKDDMSNISIFKKYFNEDICKKLIDYTTNEQTSEQKITELNIYLIQTLKN